MLKKIQSNLEYSMFLNKVFNLSVSDVKQILPTFSYLSNDSSHYIEQTLESVRMIDSREAHDHYRFPNRFPMRNEDIGWMLTPKALYQFTINVDVTIPEDSIGLIYSMDNTINNSIQLITTLVKPGKYSTITVTANNNNGETYIEQGTVIGQLILVSSEKLDEIKLPVKESVTIIEPTQELPTVSTIIEPIVETVPEIINVEEPVQESAMVESTVETIIEPIVETVDETISDVQDAQNTRPKRK